MKKYPLAAAAAALLVNNPASAQHEKTTSFNSENKPAVQALTCKLTSPELRERKATILTGLQRQVLQKKELPDGFAYRFSGSDAILDELNNFIKTERLCCDFFRFLVIVGAENEPTWLHITGPEGAKEFIAAELNL